MINDNRNTKDNIHSQEKQHQQGEQQQQGQRQQQPSTKQWFQMIGQVVESMTGKNMSTTISFQNLEVDVPRAQGPGGRDLGSAKWTVNGKIIWTTELHKTGDSR